jgi:ABC-type transport system substrate-binding protein/benzoyl-CoA reductase/2-hydroxyglutaryl-CoA dehydratase subunit BcrC/BadD/HgdB
MTSSAVSALDEARAMYTDPHAIARAAKSDGARICGYVGSDVPEELILAAGYVPVRVRGDASQPPVHGDRYGYLAEPVTRSVLARLTDGTYDYLDGLVIDHSIDAHALLFFNLRQVRLMLPEVRLPKLHFFDLLHLPHLTTARYNRDRLRELAETLADWSGGSISDEAIVRQISHSNAHRAGLAEVVAFRQARPPRIRGSDALALTGCAMLMPRPDFTRVIDAVSHEVPSQPPLEGRRLFVTGSNHESTEAYAAIERAEVVIVGDDHDLCPVQFHTGREFTSADIAWNMQHVLKPQGTANFGPQAQQWTFETPDKYTVIFKSDQPRPFAWEFFHNFNMLDPETGQGPDAATKAVGTGPFAMADWAQGDHFTLKKNQNYWMSGRPYLDGINFTVFKDAQAPVVQFEAGALDGLLYPPLRDGVRLGQDQSFQLLTNKYAGSFFTTLNVNYPPLDDKRVRQALNYAINRERWAKSEMLGQSDAVDLPWGPLNLAYEAGKNSIYTFDLDKARFLLKDAGVANAEFDFLVQPAHTERIHWGEMVQADLAPLGIKLNIVTMDASSWNNATTAANGPTTYKGLNGSPTGQGGNGEPANSAYATSNWWRYDGVNSSNYNGAAYHDLVSKLLVEPDQDKRKSLYSQVNDVILDDCWLLIYATRPDQGVFQSKVHDFVWAPFSRTEFTNVWLG